MSAADLQEQIATLRTQRKALEDQMSELHTKLMGIQYQLDKLQPRTPKPCSHQRRSYEVPMPEVTARALGVIPPPPRVVDGVMLKCYELGPRVDSGPFDDLPRETPVLVGMGEDCGDDYHGAQA